MALALTRPRAVSPLGWLRITLRLTAMAVLLLACVPLFYLLRLFTHHNPMPRFVLLLVTVHAV